MPDRLTDYLRTTTEARFEADWERQRRTALDILQRLRGQEGVILADQVGMGKTYVALAVAVQQIISTPALGQVVVFVPSAVADKWVREWRKFSESLLEPEHGIRCVEMPVRSGEEFLRKLSDDSSDRDHLIVVTHTALTATLKDNFIQLALLYYAIRGRHGVDDIRQRIARWSTGRTGLISNADFKSEVVAELLVTPPSKWHEVWNRLTGDDLLTSPIPAALEFASSKLRLETLRDAVETLPSRHSDTINSRLEKVRVVLNKATQVAWRLLLNSTKLDLPLLIVDEAHRLKNPRTNISGLFAPRSDDGGAGAFAGIFRRMLFLTATPFELGHAELIEVLARMGAVRPLEPQPARSLRDRLEELETVLTEAQISALSFDDAWGRISIADEVLFDAWTPAASPPDGISAGARVAWEHARAAVRSRRRMHEALRPWIIRHQRPRRREYHEGAAITSNGVRVTGGLVIPDSAALPFLLGARVQSLAVDTKRARPLYAYGIVSSFEAFSRLDRGDTSEGRDSDDALDEDSAPKRSDAPPADVAEPSDAVGWYRAEIERALTGPGVREAHPKVQATVEKAARLWLDGEKCLVFCWFIRTGVAVERALSRRIEELVLERAAKALGLSSPAEADVALDEIASRLFRRDGASYERVRKHLIEAIVEDAGGHQDVLDLTIDAAIRHLRTRHYLVRYTRLTAGVTDEEVAAGIAGDNPRGIVLLDRWRLFARQLAKARVQIQAIQPNAELDSEFSRIAAALLGEGLDDPATESRGAQLRPVRLANGTTQRDIRERLITSFNTPFFPDLLVASSVMGEGIDLHQACRHVIHHDLDWNPSVLEQRTGRLDRIGALAEREGKNIEVYEPYLAGTHDEKMFRVVKDRAQWFDIVMGRATGTDERLTDAEEIRVPLHGGIVSALVMDLQSPISQVPDSGIA